MFLIQIKTAIKAQRKTVKTLQLAQKCLHVRKESVVSKSVRALVMVMCGNGAQRGRDFSSSQQLSPRTLPGVNKCCSQPYSVTRDDKLMTALRSPCPVTIPHVLESVENFTEEQRAHLQGKPSATDCPIVVLRPGMQCCLVTDTAVHRG